MVVELWVLFNCRKCPTVNRTSQVALHDLEAARTGTVSRSCNLELTMFTTNWQCELWLAVAISENLLHAQISVHWRQFHEVKIKLHFKFSRYTRSVNKVMRLIQYNSVLTFKLQIEFVPFKIVPLGGYTPPESLFPLFVTTLVVANRNCF